MNGARPGIFMYAVPKAGQSARQEFLKGQAEDHFQVLRLGVGVHVPYGSSQQALLTKEWTPLEPGVLDHKFYLRGVGTVLEQTVKGGQERNELGVVPLRLGSGHVQNIHTLYNYEPPATEEEVRDAALQYVRKISGFTKPSRANEEAFARAVDEVSEATARLLDSLVTTASPRNREVEAERKRARAAERFATAS